ncbi:LPO_1073/Vpar_1526 family protein [Hyphomicrobium sp. MC1]|uniref:LPO_1073/Vpar_1526 family protein n=1 Tax=Hyphomicrobium sp. (strain MC1) TaxID=717785 RepID=UPI000213F03F|nr:LPO_1073/Vpar_1526 family protein [Hyphomicrobium sp. MC1]CCB67946.1 protein of unknown function [Hyphomicrobium sp. MC1]
MTKQNQEVGNDSIAAQAQGNITIIKNEALTVEEIEKILASFTPMFRALAKEEARALMEDLSQGIFERLAKHPDAAASALKTPDFQYVLGEAAHAYARSGASNVKEILLDLIESRCQRDDRTRVTLSLNEAINKTAVLTKEEFAVLSIVFLIRYTRLGAKNFVEFAGKLKECTSPLMGDITREESVANYLNAQSCGHVSIGQAKFIDILRSNYIGFFMRGCDLAELETIFAPDLKSYSSQLIIHSMHDNDKFQVGVRNEQELFEHCNKIGFPKPSADKLWAVAKSKAMNNQQILDKLQECFPEASQLQSLWDETYLCHLELTSIGIAIGHANIQRVAEFEGELAMWIR